MTLLAPAFLLGLLAIGLPLWLHRLSSTNPNRQPFSSVMFLEAGEPRRVLARQLQYWLLLALRIGVLALLAFTFAGPQVMRAVSGADTASARLQVVLIDASASMSLGARWERARAAALDVLDGLGPADQAEVLLAGRRLEIVAAATNDRATLRERVNTLQPSLYYTDYGQTMVALDGVLRGVEQPVILHFITDAQSASLPTRFADLAPRRPLELELHDVGRDEEDNWSVDALAGSARDGMLTASVSAYASAETTRSLTLELNGRAVSRQDVTLPARGSVQVALPGIELESGPNRLRAVLDPPDQMVADDQHFLVLQRPEPQDVLLVSGDPRARDTVFVASAMETAADLSLKVERGAPAALIGHALTGYAFIVVTDAGLLNDEQSAALRAYVETGGSLWMAFGPRSATLAQVPLTGERLQGFVQGGAARTAPYLSAGVIDTQHAALQHVEALRRSKIFRYVALAESPEDQVLIRLEQGTPLLIERVLGTGRVMLFASSLDRQWNDLPIEPVYVPFVAGISGYLAGQGVVRSSGELGGTLALTQLGLGGGQIFDPRGEKALGLAGSEGQVELDQSGFYEATGGGKTAVVAVNLDPRESDTRRFDAETLARWQALGRPDGAGAAATGAAPAASQPAPLWPALLVLLVVAAIMESLVGNWHLKVRRGMAT